VQGGVRCQHGPAECRLDRVINCATHLNPGQDRWLPFVTCLEAAEGGAEGMEGAVEGCAAKAGLDAAAIRGCAEGRQGDALERAAAEETAALRPPHRWVPWVVVNGIPLGEDLDSLWRYICVAYAGQRPAACYAPPPSLAAARGLQLPAGAGRRGVSLADVAATEPEGAVA
jgi:interferon gamma-inducible protein 30